MPRRSRTMQLSHHYLKLKQYDNTCEGIKSNNCWSVQFHPEAAPGPMDANVLFEKVTEMIDG